MASHKAYVLVSFGTYMSADKQRGLKTFCFRLEQSRGPTDTIQTSCASQRWTQQLAVSPAAAVCSQLKLLSLERFSRLLNPKHSARHCSFIYVTEKQRLVLKIKVYLKPQVIKSELQVGSGEIGTWKELEKSKQ